MSQGDKDQQENTNDQSIQTASEESSKETTKKKSKAGLVLFIFVLVLLAFGGGGYGTYYYLNEKTVERESALNAGLQKVENGFNALKDADRDLNQKLSRKQDDLQRALTAAVAGSENQMTALAERLAASESTSSVDWTLAEVEYLLRIANQRLITSRDHDTAIDMLQAADTILKELAYPELAGVRRQLAVDITELQLANQVDVEGVYFTLEAMASEIAKLDQFAPEEIAQTELDLDEESSQLMLLWSGIVQVLSKYVRIDTDAGEPEYLVTDEQEVVRRLAIQLQLRQAQLALLSGQQEIYSVALSGAAESISLHYGAAHIAKSLEDLSGRQVEQKAMDVNDSVRALSDVIDRLSRTNSPAVKG